MTTNYDEHQQPPESEEIIDETLTVETEENPAQQDNSAIPAKKIDLNEKMGSHLDKLDSLITKAENAQYSMRHQTNQMKKIIKK